MHKLRASRTRRHLAPPIEFGMMIFVVLVGLWVLGRIAFLSTILMVPDCLSIEPVLLGQGDRIDAALGLIAVTGVVGWRERSLTWSAAAFGTVNIGIAALLIAQWVVGWSFFHPDSWQAKIVMPLGPHVRYLSVQSATVAITPFDEMPGWENVGPNAYYNAEIGIFAREEVIRRCFSAAFVRQNLMNRHPDALTSGTPISAIPDSQLERHDYAYIYYDRHNQYLTSDIYRYHDRYADLQRRDAQRDASGRKVDPSAVWALVERSLDPGPGPESLERPYSRGEIDEMVRETWDREAPLP